LGARISAEDGITNAIRIIEGVMLRLDRVLESAGTPKSIVPSQ
jgi:hypothetical protein